MRRAVNSWLDHLISIEDGNNVITNMSVLYGAFLVLKVLYEYDTNMYNQNIY